MNADFLEPIVIEPERYELFERPRPGRSTRRDFFQHRSAAA